MKWSCSNKPEIGSRDHVRCLHIFALYGDRQVNVVTSVVRITKVFQWLWIILFTSTSWTAERCLRFMLEHANTRGTRFDNEHQFNFFFFDIMYHMFCSKRIRKVKKSTLFCFSTDFSCTYYKHACAYQGIERHNPRWNTCAYILGCERTEWYIFPFLNISSTPVIHEHQTENAVCSSFNVNGFAKCIASTFAFYKATTIKNEHTRYTHYNIILEINTPQYNEPARNFFEWSIDLGDEEKVVGKSCL